MTKQLLPKFTWTRVVKYTNIAIMMLTYLLLVGAGVFNYAGATHAVQGVLYIFWCISWGMPVLFVLFIVASKRMKPTRLSRDTK